MSRIFINDFVVTVFNHKDFILIIASVKEWELKNDYKKKIELFLDKEQLNYDVKEIVKLFN